jgi:hypothetical protein
MTTATNNLMGWLVNADVGKGQVERAEKAEVQD